MALDLEERNSVQDEGENPPPNSDKYGIWSGEEIPGVLRPVTIRVRTAYSIAAT